MINKLNAALINNQRLKASSVKLNWGVNEDRISRPCQTERTHFMRVLVRGNFLQIKMRRTDYKRKAYSTGDEHISVVLNYTSREAQIFRLMDFVQP